MPYPVYLHRGEEEELVNTPSPVWLDPKATRKELLDYGTKVSQSSALDAFPIRTEHGRIEGVLYVLPFRTQFSVRNSHKVYLKRMLLSEDDCNLLPSWAFFIRCLVNADGLLSTASRESFVSNDSLKDARKRLGSLSRNISGLWCRTIGPFLIKYWMFITFTLKPLLRKIMSYFVCLWIIFRLRRIRE